MTSVERAIWAIVAAILAPAIGLIAMLLVSERLDSAWEGGWDWGVLLAGSVLAASVTFLYGAVADAPRRSVLRWAAVTWLLTAGAAIALILALVRLMEPFAAMD